MSRERCPYNPVAGLERGTRQLPAGAVTRACQGHPPYLRRRQHRLLEALLWPRSRVIAQGVPALAAALGGRADEAF